MRVVFIWGVIFSLKRIYVLSIFFLELVQKASHWFAYFSLVYVYLKIFQSHYVQADADDGDGSGTEEDEADVMNQTKTDDDYKLQMQVAQPI